MHGLTLVGTTGTTPNRDIAIWSVLSDGTANTSFNTTGKMTIDFGGDDVAASIAFDGGTGDYFVAATTGAIGSRNFALARVNNNGTLDTAFDTDGKRIFDFNGDDVAADLAVQTNGRVVMVGSNFVGNNADFAAIRLTNIGVLDTSFSDDGKMNVTFGSEDTATSVVLDSNNNIIIGGFTNVNLFSTGNDFAVARVTTAGVLDTTFSTDGKTTVDIDQNSLDFAWDVAVYPNTDATNAGRIVVAGHSGSGLDDFAMVRFEVDGRLDNTFSGDGKANISFGISEDFGRAIILDNTGRMYVIGYTNNLDGVTSTAGGNDIGILRLTPTGALDTTFDTDGRKTVDINNSNDQAISAFLDSQFGSDLFIGSTIVNNSSDFAVTRIEE